MGLDQRIIDPFAPDEPGTKVNQCVDNIMQIWQDGQAEKLTQLVFCDISTPQTAPPKKAATTNLDNPELHALETSIDLPEEKLSFTVYDDIRKKLIDRGMPPGQIAFIHDAKTEVKKKELFAKVRSGKVRVLLGSTQKMGAGTNVQDRLIAIHDLDCPWRPGDLEQRKGRIVRQGNMNAKVHIFRYVTEGTFDAYLWQTVENKQKFISQIMTSKSPVRSCNDVDETALSYAEIKALCAGDPRIKERMDLSVEVARLKLTRADHQSKKFKLEDDLLKYFPEQIRKSEENIRGIKTDMQTLAAHPLPEKKFVGIEINGTTFTKKEEAGVALIEACKKITAKDEAPLGHYRGFDVSARFDIFQQEHTIVLRGEMSYSLSLGAEAKSNINRMDKTLSEMPSKLESAYARLEMLRQQQEAAKAEIAKPFPNEEELAVKSARLAELDAELNIDNAEPESIGGGQSLQVAKTRSISDIAKSERPSVLEGLKRSLPPREKVEVDKSKKHIQER